VGIKAAETLGPPITFAMSTFRTRLGPAPRVFAAALIVAGVASCATPMLKSSFQPPDQFAAASTSEEQADAAWWDRYEDPVLSELIRQAANENRDVKIAAERVRAARAGETISRSWLLPSFGATAGGIDYSTGYSDATKQVAPDFKAVGGGASVSWEIDLSGRLRAGSKAAAADRSSTEDAARGVRLLVLTDVASNYFTLVGALRQLDSVRAISAAHDETLRLVTTRNRVGLASTFDLERARTAASSAHAAIPPLETLAAQSRHRIAVLIGDQAANAGVIEPWKGVAVIPAIRPGQPAALLERRPDLLALRARLDAANWRRRQAVAEWFPRLVMSALFGRQNLEINGADLGAARFTNVAGLLTMPIFNWGRTRSINEIAESGQREALLGYEDAIARALEDVENGLVSLRDARTRAAELQNAASSADAALARAQSLYDRGQIDLLPLLDAQRTRLTVRISATDSDTRLMLATVDLFKALGGGWQAFEPAAATSASAALAPNSGTPAFSIEETQ